MSVFVQEVLSLLKRNFVKTTLSPTDDYFQFVRKGALSRARASAGGFAPQGQALSISAGSWLCDQTGPNGQGRFASVKKLSGNISYVPVFTTASGICSWKTLEDSIIRQSVASPMVYIGDSDKTGSLTVYEKVFVPKLGPQSPATRGKVVFASKIGELKTNETFTFTETSGGNMFAVDGPVTSITFGTVTSGASSPPTITRINNKLILSGPVFDAASGGGGTGLPTIGQVLIAREDPNIPGQSDGRVIWGSNAAFPPLTEGRIYVGDSNNEPATFGAGQAGQVLTSGGVGGTVAWQQGVIVLTGNPFRLPLFESSGTLQNSLLEQDDNKAIGDPGFANQTITNDGKWINTGTMTLLTAAQDAVAEKVVVLDSNGLVKFRYANSIGVQGTSTLRRVPLWSPDGRNLQSSLLIQSDMIQPPANYPVVDPSFVEQKLTNDGSLQQTKQLYLDTVAQDDTLTEVLVRDTGAANEVKFRNVATIIPPVGFDTLPMSTTANWTQTFLNAYISLDDTTVPFRSIKGMTTLTDGQTGVVIAENVKQGTFLADDVIRFPSGWGTVGNLFNNKISWAAGFNNGYPTSTLKYGESLKFKYHNYEIAGGGFDYKYVLYWESCCKLFSLNTCPTVQNDSYTMVEDSGGIGDTLIAVDDGYGNYTPVYTISALADPAAGTLTLTNSATGAFTFVPALNYYGSTTFTYTFNDGYCESDPGIITLNVTPVDEAPEWTSDDPVTLNTYPALTGGDPWTYTWTTADADHPCGVLSYDITVNDGTGPVTIYTTAGGPTGLTWLTFTPDNPHTCTGTLSGTYPVDGGDFDVIMTVTDPDNLSAVQQFTIGGLLVTKDSYFVFCSDTSGSMVDTIQTTSQMSSVPEVTSKSDGLITGSQDIRLASGGNPGRVNDPSGLIDDSFLCIVVGMEVSGNGIAAGTVVSSIGTLATSPPTLTLTLSANQFTTASDVLTFTLTQTQKTADYNNVTNFRNLLQDFYATGGTASGTGNPGGVPNTNAATNGQDFYDSHLYWYHNREERPLGYLGFQAQGGALVATIGSAASGAYFPDAKQITVMAWADESGTNPGQPTSITYQASPGETGTGTWNNRDVTTNAVLLDDISKTRDFITVIEQQATNAGHSSSNMYRGIAFRVSTGGNEDLEEIMGPGGFAQTGGRFSPTPPGTTPYSNSFAPEALAYSENSPQRSFKSFSNGAPKRLTYVGNVTEGANESYYYNLVRSELVAIGFSL